MGRSTMNNQPPIIIATHLLPLGRSIQLDRASCLVIGLP
jgi:hypothetical protein